MKCLKMETTRLIGSLPKKVLSPLERLARDHIIDEPEVTAMQITQDEEFMVLCSSSVFAKLTATEVISMIWQHALDQQNIGASIDSIIKLSAKRCEDKPFTIIVVIFKNFKDKINKMLE